MGYCMTDAAAIKQFVSAGNARFTLVSKKTGARFTYRVRASQDRKKLFGAVLTGRDNENSYSYMGLVELGLAPALIATKGSKIDKNSVSFKALDWFLGTLVTGKRDAVEFWHEGKCGKCGRSLTVPSSISNGLGPECVKSLSKADKRDNFLKLILA